MYVVVLYVLVLRTLQPENNLAQISWTIFFTITLFTAAPIVIFTTPFQNYVYGYMQITYHNPPMAVVKPFMIPAFFMIAALLDNAETPRKQPYYTTILAVLVILTLVSKPNFIFVVLPAAGLLGLYLLVRRRPMSIAALVWGLAVPGVLILAAQYFFALNSNILEVRSEGLGIDPFAVLAYHAETINPFANQLIPFKFLMSMAFPLALYGMHFSEARKNTVFNLAWITFLVGAFQSYFLVEQGERLYHGNFTWGGQIGFLVLFAAASVFFMRQYRPAFTENFREALHWRFDLLFFLYVLHFISGLGWYVLHLNGKFKFFY
jgi:hypothetical protein